ncbi:MAG: alpha/beta hydrolase [Alphaproteobacteria bacterium]|nr:MAG: alpha/beta hydrolase [Alphaproteobacteria bacterium]
MTKMLDWLEDQYVTDLARQKSSDLFAEYAERSAECARTLGTHIDVPYGDAPRQRLDIYMPASDAPVPALFFIHGGYWKAGDKSMRSFPAPAWVNRGCAFIAINYRLLPDTPLASILSDARSALIWVMRNAEGIGIDPARIAISGTSAGGHLSAMLATEDWRAYGGGAPGGISCAALISGLFDLGPLLATSMGSALALTPADAHELSPVNRLPCDQLPVMIAVGEQESDAFKYQSKALANRWQAFGLSPKLSVVPERDHFTVFADLADPDSELSCFVAQNLGV